MIVHIIADYGPGDLAFAEVVQRLKGYLPDAEPILRPVPPFATLAAGFCVAQLGLNPVQPGPSFTTTSRRARIPPRPRWAMPASAWPSRVYRRGFG
jgi:hypothetical protein